VGKVPHALAGVNVRSEYGDQIIFAVYILAEKVAEKSA
jgi:hypothetical protein